MSEENKVLWTEDQRSAIELRARDLLVSAGAGSGKTSVMKERIIDRICDPDDPCDIDDMLIVTFSVKATGELSERISKGLRKRYAETGDPRVKKAIADFGNANIYTINGFCYYVVRRSFAALGLPASVRIADEAEDELISEETMEETLESFFENSHRYGIDDFPSFIENFINDRDDKLADIFLDIYSKLLTLPEGVGILKKKAEELTGVNGETFFESGWGSLVKRQTFDMLDHYRGLLADAAAYFSRSEKQYLNYGVPCEDAVEHIDRILNKKDPDYDFVRNNLVGYSFPKLGSKRISEDEKTSEFYFYRAQRNDFKKAHEELIGSLYSMPSSEIGRLASMTSQTVLDLGCFLEEFERRLTAKKKDLGVVSFSDCERYTYELFTDKNGGPTEFALEYREKYKEIYIDEYQDTNALQDSIFRAIARPSSRFLVGDVKQSIYAFRSAEPALFSGYRDAWKKYSEGDGNTASTVFLSENFRSSPQILRTVNAVFDKLFPLSGRIGYKPDDALKVPEFKKDETHDKVKVVVTPLNERLEEGEDPSAAGVGLDYIASTIASLIADGESPNDCAVIVRTNNMVRKAAKALAEYGVAYDAVVKEEFFAFPEILLVMSVLRVINNPTRDVHLSAVLTSPLCGLSMDDITKMRLDGGDAPLWEIASASDDPRVRRFLSDLTEWREYARKVPAHRVIHMLYDKYSLIGACCKGRDPQRSAIVKINCGYLYDLALKYEANSYKGLYSFIEYADSLASSELSLDIPSGEKDNQVKIMNVHQSKGLEFKNCFFFSGSRSLRSSKDKGNIVFSKRLGFASKVRDRELPIRYDTPVRQAIIRDNYVYESAEELRILYVALTRAMERLYIVTERTKTDKTVDYYTHFGKYLSDQFVYESDNFGDWVLAALAADGSSPDWEIIELDRRVGASAENKEDIEEGIAGEDGDEIAGERERYADLIKEKLDYVYPYAASTTIPAKLSVSALYPEVIDDMIPGAAKPEAPRLAVPSFRNRSGKRGGSFAGTATHLFMQFCDFDNLEKHGAAYELKRLREEEFLSGEAAAEVRLDNINTFVSSGLFAEIRRSPEVWRERRFNVLLPARDFTANKEDRSLDGETVLVQGVVDCVFRDTSGGLVLIDYKTDSVKGLSAEEAEDMLRKKHSMQLGYYKIALEKLTGDRVSRTELYSFGLGRTVEINC
ncbi:MAG: UvrD-helicase domain-containing protein [Clostridia bacterium]|nr:UvrD-helicase domain-containing protein [Clostridia bacterium]